VNHELSSLAARVRAVIRRSQTEPFPPLLEDEFNALALDSYRAQFQHNAAYRAICAGRNVSPDTVGDWWKIPAVPPRAFKELELTSLAAAEREFVYWSSATTGESRSRHFHSRESVALYETSLWAWFERQVLAGRPDLCAVALTPPPAAAPNSSLAHMFGEILRWQGRASEQHFVGRPGPEGAWEVDFGAWRRSVEQGMVRNEPLLLLGTAFNFVHLLDWLAAGGSSLRLPAGSVVLETGGYKGRSRELTRSELHEALCEVLGVARDQIVSEYGMSELSSQAYAYSGAADGRQWFRFPPWARAQVVSPETGWEVAEGATGVLRILDLANVWSVAAQQTEDLAVRHGEAFELLGRIPAAEPRGCSRMTA
jgi:hypothetical protein